MKAGTKPLIIVGLGPGGAGDLSLRAWECLRAADRIYLRTARHPVVVDLEQRGVVFESFDAVYESTPDFESAYATMARVIMDKLAERREPVPPLVFAVPGHPLLAERVVQLLLAEVGREQIEIVPGMSAVDAICAALGLDPGQGLCVLDALQLAEQPPDPSKGTILLQVYSQLVAADAKIQLMESYPDEQPITVIRAAGIPGQEQAETVALFELDRLLWVDHLTSVYIPPAEHPRRQLCQHSLDPLISVMNTLLSPQGCPWDREQTHLSIRPYLLEEAYEVLEALNQQDMEKLEEELGDLLLQIVFHAALAERDGIFGIDRVVRTITEKMIERHPHVFAAVTAKTSREVLANWEQIKKERSKRPLLSFMEDIPTVLPALLKASKIQAKAARVGFDWPTIEGPWAKVEEEAEELRRAQASGTAEQIAGELGDLLFATVNLARFLKVDPEIALLQTTAKFVARFQYMEQKSREEGRPMNQSTLAELDKWWEEAKEKIG